jgi:hypothetical protein
MARIIKNEDGSVTFSKEAQEAHMRALRDLERVAKERDKAKGQAGSWLNACADARIERNAALARAENLEAALRGARDWILNKVQSPDYRPRHDVLAAIDAALGKETGE